MSRREFTEDGWKFRVTFYTYFDDSKHVKVQFYDDDLLDPSVEDVHSVDVEDPKETVAEEREVLSFGPFSWTTTVERAVNYDGFGEMVETAKDKAWDRIEEINRSPSQQVEDALRGVTDDE